MTLLSLCTPPRHGEAEAAYYADVLAKLPCATWYDHRFAQVGTPGYVPCLWDGNVERLAQFTAIVSAAAELPKRVLMWNEPCRKDQANMTPEEAVTALRQYLARWGDWALPAYIGGVNVSVHMDAPAYAWLESLVAGMTGRERALVHGWHIHAYGGIDDASEAVFRFRAWMEDNALARPVIISECGTDNNPAALMMMLEAMIDDGVIEAAYWFSAYYAPWNATGLLTADGELTAIGEAFVAEREVVRLPVVYA